MHRLMKRHILEDIYGGHGVSREKFAFIVQDEMVRMKFFTVMFRFDKDGIVSAAMDYSKERGLMFNIEIRR